MSDKVMTVRHRIESGHHFVDIYPPDHKYPYLAANWPVTDEDTAVEALWSGYMEAADWRERFGAKYIAIYSTDEEALDRFEQEIAGAGAESE